MLRHYLHKALPAILAVLLIGSSAVVSAAEAASAARLRLRWEVQRNVFTPDNTGGRSLAMLTLTNLDRQALPARGWAIYFNCVAGLELKPIDGPFEIERVSGTWFRMRPGPGFQELASGQAARLSFYHPEVMVKTAKAPTGPYVVFDSAPDLGHPLADYAIAPLTRAEQWDHGPKDPMPIITAEETFKRNQTIADLPEDALAPVFPTPLHFKRGSGSLRWTSMPSIVAAPALRAEVALATRILKPYLRSGAGTEAASSLRLLIAPVAGQQSAEAYTLNIDPIAGVTVSGASPAGLARGLESLRELILAPKPGNQGLSLPSIQITDAPRFEYRGVQLDVARNFQSKATVLRLLDLMARYKLNKFHFHLTDDEGWRLEIPGLPELTKVGARRGHTLDSHEHLQPAYGSGPDVADPYGSGFYTAADYIEILKYAAARHIEVIPEIEMPGHARAAVKAMEARARRLEKTGHGNARQFLLSDPNDQSKYRSAQLYTDNVMNPGLPSTYAFIDKVLAELVSLHKKAGVALHTIHVGADELPNGAWEESPATLALMRSKKLASTVDAWDYFYDRVDRMLRKHGLFASGWEELGARKVKLHGADKLIPNPVFTQRGFNLYVWNDLDDAQDLAYRMANAGYRTILAPATHLYFDMAHNKNPEEPGVNWAAYVDLDTVFDFIPFDFIRKSATDSTRVPGRDGLSDYGQKNVIGLEGTLFTETVRDQGLMDYLLMPRMLALAERAWAPDPSWTREPDVARATLLRDQAWSSFVNKLGKHVLPKLDDELPGVQYRIAPPGLKIEQGKVLVNHQLPGFTLRYTTDGSEPNATSTRVTGPIAAKGVIQVAAFDSSGRKGRLSRVENR